MYLNGVFGILTFLFSSWFTYLKFKKPQTIWLGITFIGLLANLGILITIYLIEKNQMVILTLLAIFVALLILFMPFSIVLIFLTNGIQLIQKEGLKFSNLLSLLSAIGLLFYLFIWPKMVDISQNSIPNIIYQIISFSVIYFSFILIIYTVTNLLNLIHIKNHKIDYFIVLGAGLFGEKVTPLLASRIDKGLELLKKQKSGKIILSGGQGSGETIPEGEAMIRYALKHGATSEQVLKETHSTSTLENIKFSKEIIDNDWTNEQEPKIAIVTNNYHILRGLLKARELGISALGYGARSKFYFSLNAFLREYVAYLQMHYKFHILVISLLSSIQITLYLLLLFIS